MLTLLLVCAFSPRVHSIPRGPHFNKLSVVAGRRLNLLRKLNFDFVKVIFRLSAEAKVNPQLAHGANITATQYHCESNITVEDNLTAKANFPKGDNLLDIAGFFGYTRFAS